MTTSVRYNSAIPPVVNLGAQDYTGRFTAVTNLRSWHTLYGRGATVEASGRVLSVEPRLGTGRLIRPSGGVGPTLAAYGGIEGAAFTGESADDYLISDFQIPGDNFGLAMIVYEDGQSVGSNRHIGGVGSITNVNWLRRAGGRWAMRGATGTTAVLGNGFRLVIGEQIGSNQRVQGRSRTVVGDIAAGTYTSSWVPTPGSIFVGSTGTASQDWMSGIHEVWSFTGSVFDNAAAMAELIKYATEVYFA